MGLKKLRSAAAGLNSAALGSFCHAPYFLTSVMQNVNKQDTKTNLKIGKFSENLLLSSDFYKLKKYK